MGTRTPRASKTPTATRDGSASDAPVADVELPDVAVESAGGNGTDQDNADTPDSYDDEEPQDNDLEELFLVSGDPTLTRFNAADISLDMDVPDWNLDADADGSDDEGSGDDYNGSGDESDDE
ncbi:hypothetical protein DFH09DRAFT_1093217 [Mycena vulgaris]|nr:hypothetical protein DFH09DRAFT_1093217 [Mycena vulgaris]